MAFGLSEKSRGKLAGVHGDLVRVVLRAIEISEIDFMVVEGVRTPERQRQLYMQGRNGNPGKVVTWTLKSNHFVNSKTGKGHAVDLLPAPYDWSNRHGEFNKMAKAMLAAAKELGVPIRWGADWNRNGISGEKGETDSPHFELWGL